MSQPGQIDARADVYGIGAVGYFLLTGSPVFSGDSVMEICQKHLQAAPESPSARAHRAVSPELETLLLCCLAKSPLDRPADAGDLLRRLEACAVHGRWTTDAAAWWAAHSQVLAARQEPPAADPQPETPSMRPDPTHPAYKGSSNVPRLPAAEVHHPEGREP